MNIEQILEQLLGYPTKYVVITGGEPLLADELDNLCSQLRSSGRHVTLETAATVDRVVEVDLASVSPKLSNSRPSDRQLAKEHESHRLNIPTIRAYLDRAQRMGSQCQLKFVLAKPKDIEQVKSVLEQLGPLGSQAEVMLMPQAVNRRQLSRRSAWRVELCKEHGYRFCARLQISLYGNQPGA